MESTRRESEKRNLLSGKDKDLELLDVRSDAESSTSTLYDNMESDEKLQKMDVEKQNTPTLSTPAAVRSNRMRLTVWMIINTLATIAIVFTNKAIFNDPSFKQCQAAFAAFHFFVTSVTLYILSRPIFNLFIPQSMRIRTMLPLASAMCLNIILMNLSLALSSITFYQIARILLTPAVALLNFLFYRKYLPRKAVISLIPMCLGVAIISYYEPKPSKASKVPAVGFLSVLLAMASVLVSAVYTIWVGSYQRKYEINGFQLLYNQAPIGAVLLLYVIPWTDKFPHLENVPGNKWGMILLSGGLAAMINLSQFFIIAGAGPVSSTVVGHVKTCMIVTLGWIYGGKPVADRSVFGVLLAIGSIFWYSAIMMKANVMSAPQADAPTKESAKSSLNEARTRVLLGVRSLQPREWIEQVRSTLEGYTNFVRMTLTSRNEGVSG